MRALLAALVISMPAAAIAQGPVPASYGYPPPGEMTYPPGSYASGPMYPGYGPACPPYGGGGVCPETMYELLPDDRYSHGDEECWRAFRDVFQEAYLRVEYLNWSFDDPGHQIVGAPRASGDERGLFNAIEPASQTVVGLAKLTTYDAVGLHRNNGVRGVFGLPTRVGTFEAGVSVLEQADAHLFSRTYTDFTSLQDVIPAVTLLNNGTPVDNLMILFSEGMNVQLRTEYFTTEANFITPPLTPNQPILIRPLFGFQYIRFWNNVDIFGTDIDQVDPTNPDDNITLNHRIYSESNNNVFAPQVGVRFEFVHEYFSLGVTPKFLLGFNRHKDEVFSEQIFSASEGRLTTREEDSEFSPSLDLSVYGRVHLGKHLSLFCSYQLYFLNNVSQANDNIYYNTINGTQPDIVLSPHQEGVFIDGITVGGEFRFH